MPPGLRPATQLDILRARIAQAKLEAARQKRSRLNGEALAKGTIGTRDAQLKLQAIHSMAGSKSSLNYILAKELDLIYRHLENRPDQLIGAESQALGNAANKLVKFGRNKKIVLTLNERKAIVFYLKAARMSRVKKQ